MKNSPWPKYGFFIHIVILIFSGGVAWASVAAHGTRLDKLEAQMTTVDKIKEDLGVVKESVRWIEKTMGRK